MALELPIFRLLLALLAGVLLVLGAWLWVVWRWYRLRPPRPRLIRVQAADGWSLAIYHRPAARRRFEEPVLLCHGLSANHKNLDFEPPYSLAAHLAEAGFECFSIDLRGTGASTLPPGLRGWSRYTVDDHIRFDAAALVEEALARTGARRAFWVGHSMGGLIGYAAAQGALGDRLAGVVSLGSPAFFRYRPWMVLVLRLGHLAGWPLGIRQSIVSVGLAPFLGHLTLPLSDVILNPLHVPPPLQRKVFAQVVSSIGRGVLGQFADWVRNDAFRSVDGRVDYREGLRKLRVPLLAIAGSEDRLAPPDVVREAFLLAGSEDKSLMIFGREFGSAMEYGHGDLVFGTGAPTEVYPTLTEWLGERGNPVDGSAARDGAGIR
jgi:pimeloyl-ACP methyl ester carboxylesterase